MDTMVIAEQPMPACLAEACGWLLAAEGNASAGIQPSRGRNKNFPTKRARNDQSRCRPTTPMNLK